MVAFRRPSEAVQFGVKFATNTGVDYIGIRVGIHSGEVEIRENDIYGINVNLASRVQHSIPRDRILSTESVKRDYERRLGAETGVRFMPEEVDLKSFGKETLYRILTIELREAKRMHFNARAALLGSTVRV